MGQGRMSRVLQKRLYLFHGFHVMGACLSFPGLQRDSSLAFWGNLSGCQMEQIGHCWAKSWVFIWRMISAHVEGHAANVGALKAARSSRWRQKDVEITSYAPKEKLSMGNLLAKNSFTKTISIEARFIAWILGWKVDSFFFDTRKACLLVLNFLGSGARDSNTFKK